jgi:hypothetical protein
VTESNDRLQEALAAYLEYLEMGGSEPDTSHLTEAEREELQELVDSIDLTEGVALGGAERRPAGEPSYLPGTREGKTLLAKLRGSLPAPVRIEPDENGLVSRIGGMEVRDRSIVGTFGGRVRVWLLEAETTQAIEDNPDCLVDLDRAFRMFPDMSAVALVGKDLSCLVVLPEDCAPQIQVPAGSLVPRRYRRAIRPVDEAIPDLLSELTPYWDPMPAFDPDSGLRIDVAEIGDDLASSAIDRQRGIGTRARKGNPKKDALLALGEKEVVAIRALAKGLFEGSLEPTEVQDRIERLAKGR